MKITVRHELTIDLGTPPRVVAHLLLTPLQTAQQKVVRWTIEMPGIDEAAAFRDGYGNKAHLVSVAKPDGPLTLVADGEFEMTDKAGVIGRLDLSPAPALFRRPEAGVTVRPELVAGLDAPGGRIAMLHQLMERVNAGAAVEAQAADGQSQSQATGVNNDESVQDFIAAARSLNVPTRYVTGYVLESETRAAGVHLWAEAWDESLGWIGFDPLFKSCPADRHVRLASALDLISVAPVRTVPAAGAPAVETVSVVAS